MKSHRSLGIVFMGTPEYAIPVLSALLDAGHEVVGVYTQPDRVSGRGKRLAVPAVKQAALRRGLPAFQPASLRRDEGAQRELQSLAPEVIVVAAYGLFLPKNVLDRPRLGCLNVHPSLLPSYRGPSPVASAILNGDSVTGVTVMKMDEGMDSGPIVSQRQASIEPDESAGELTARLFETGAELLVEVLPKWDRGELRAQAQDGSQATITHLLTREDGEIDWHRPANFIARQVRAYDPWPGSFTRWRGKIIKVIAASALESNGRRFPSPAEVVALPEGVGVSTGDGILELRTVQLAGGRAIGARDFVLGHRDIIGATLGA